jgi:colanic acid/amylovoran biosynthesis glycosyltransferase
MIAVNCSAAKFGIGRLTKTAYVALKALAWARKQNNDYDHVLAYWGNYAATSAYLFHRLLNRSVPFSMFLHASMDLYEGQVYMREKLLYADNIIVVCDFNRKYLQEHYDAIFPRISHKFYKYHLGLDLSEFQFVRDKQPGGKIVAVGGLEKYKGFDFLLRAAHIMRNRGLSCDIDLIGGGKEENSLKRLAAELQIEPNVHFLGWFTPDRVRTAISRAAVLVHPSNGIGDAVPTVIKEAMALGTPVIASNLAGIPELLDGGNCGMLVPSGDPSALASGIETLLKNNELSMTYADKARAYAEKTFDLWRNGQGLADLLCSSTRNLAEVNGRLATVDQKPAPAN